eukprot:5742563-Pleurochrysis_carterae.AAC.3
MRKRRGGALAVALWPLRCGRCVRRVRRASPVCMRRRAPTRCATRRRAAGSPPAAPAPSRRARPT